VAPFWAGITSANADSVSRNKTTVITFPLVECPRGHSISAVAVAWPSACLLAAWALDAAV